MKLTEAKLKQLILETINESDWRPELDAEGEREERQRLAMDQRGRRMRAYDKIPMSDKWDDWENRHSLYIKGKESGTFGKHTTLDYYSWSKEPMRDLTPNHFGDYWFLDPGDTQGHKKYYVVKRLISPTGDERDYQDAMIPEATEEEREFDPKGMIDKDLGFESLRSIIELLLNSKKVKYKVRQLRDDKVYYEFYQESPKDQHWKQPFDALVGALEKAGIPNESKERLMTRIKTPSFKTISRQFDRRTIAIYDNS